MSKRGPHLLSWAVDDGELIRPLHEVATVIVSVPEDARSGFYRGWERIARSAPRAGAFYDERKLAGAAIRLADLLWPLWPEQTEESQRARDVPGRDPALTPEPGGVCPRFEHRRATEEVEE